MLPTGVNNEVQARAWLRAVAAFASVKSHKTNLTCMPATEMKQGDLRERWTPAAQRVPTSN